MGLRDRFSRKKDDASGQEAPAAGEAVAGAATPAQDDMPTLVQGVPVPGPGVPDDQTFIAAPLEAVPVEAGADGSPPASDVPGEAAHAIPAAGVPAPGDEVPAQAAPPQPAAPARPG
ncbi:MAG: hypothetical protein ACKOH7_06780, partial [Solirubrobacterales bacterium]